MGFCIFDRGNRKRAWLANVWNWRAIVEAIRSLDVITDQRADELHIPYCGYGLDETEARAVADAIRDRLVPSLRDDHELTISGRVTDDPATSLPVADLNADNEDDYYRTNRRVLLEFVEFLDGSEGIDVC